MKNSLKATVFVGLGAVVIILLFTYSSNLFFSPLQDSSIVQDKVNLEKPKMTREDLLKIPDLVTPGNTEYDKALLFQDQNSVIEGLLQQELFFNFVEKRNMVFMEGENYYGIIEHTFELKPELEEKYSQIAVWDVENPPAVIIPIFTSSAYWKPGFYNYYRGECDESCLTSAIEFDKPLGFSGSSHEVKILSLLGYEMINDIDVDKNPSILEKFDKIIILHNEYVTLKEFEAIENHPNRVFLHPNALYAQIDVDHENNEISLVRGHGFPEAMIGNGFDWKYDNTKFEYEHCEETKWEFYEIENGHMLNCSPEYLINVDFELLKAIKEL